MSWRKEIRFPRLEEIFERPFFPGFSHTAFALHHESKLNRNFINGNEVPPGALISLIQKGMQLMELEANVQDVRILMRSLKFVLMAVFCYFPEST